MRYEKNDIINVFVDIEAGNRLVLDIIKIGTKFGDERLLNLGHSSDNFQFFCTTEFECTESK